MTIFPKNDVFFFREDVESILDDEGDSDARRGKWCRDLTGVEGVLATGVDGSSLGSLAGTADDEEEFESLDPFLTEESAVVPFVAGSTG